jgi:feruloyl esterase
MPTAVALLVASCHSLASLSLPHATITSATIADRLGDAPLPQFCRVAATLTPSKDSDIKIEVWLPVSGWNGKFQAVGNGGWSGAINYHAMEQALQRGYATSSTDTGHEGSHAAFALGHPEKLIDFGYRSEHEMTVAAKAVIAAFYGEKAKLSYWVGCSAGGRQGLMEAQRFPHDFDGIIAGAPASDWTGRAASALSVHQALHKDPASCIPPEKYRLIHEAVLRACDAWDGTTDGLLADPEHCSFDPLTLTCRDGQAPESCLTLAQIAAAHNIYATPKNVKTGREVPRLMPGSELGWATWGGPQAFGIGVEHFRYVVFKDPAWDPLTLDFLKDLPKAEQIDHSTINALDPDLSRFFKHHGKLIQYHGWNDPQISPAASVNYYKSVRATVGNVDASYRLFMVPGMAHCGGGEGPNTFDMLTALEQWVEHDQPPKQIIATHTTNGRVDRTRPLCSYPRYAIYLDNGRSIDDAANFMCGELWVTEADAGKDLRDQLGRAAIQ